MDWSLADRDVDLDGIYYCPHHPQGSVEEFRQVCDCRKPHPGMLLSARDYLHIDMAASYMVGDKLEDMQAAAAANVGTKVLAAAGIFLMMCGVWLGFGGVLDPTKSSGYLIVDIYNEILRMLSNRIAGLGLSIMAVGGYARYMERIGASRAMVSLLSRPLKLIRSPYIILSAT
eukprot:122502_1